VIGHSSRFAHRRSFCPLLLILTVFLCMVAVAQDQADKNKDKKPPTPGAMLAQGTMDFDTPEFTLTLVRSSQTVAALRTIRLRQHVNQ